MPSILNQKSPKELYKNKENPIQKNKILKSQNF